MAERRLLGPHAPTASRLTRVRALALIAVIGACSCDRLPDDACAQLRVEGFDIVHAVHPCGDDGDCVPSEWPGCGKPMNNDNRARLDAVRARYDAGKCPPPDPCGDGPVVFCDRNFCILRQRYQRPR
jgi:hypothetical protein